MASSLARSLLVGVLVVTMIGASRADTPNDLDVDSLGKQVGIENLQDKLPSEEEVKNALKEKCMRNGGEGAFEAIEDGKTKLTECFMTRINVTVVMEQIEEAKKTGSMDEVFGPYCKDRSIYLGCVKTFTDTFEKCLAADELEHLRSVINVTESLVDFMCFKDGDRLALFVAEGGFECISERKDGLRDCASTTLRENLPSDLSVSNMPAFLIGDSQCKDMYALQSCFGTELEKCATNTPANLVDSLFSFIRRATKCRDVPMGDDPNAGNHGEQADRATGKSAATSSRASAVPLLMAMVATACAFLLKKHALAA